MLTSFTKGNAFTCLNPKEDKLKFIFKSSLYNMLKLLYEGDGGKKRKGKGCVGALNHYLMFYSMFRS